MLLELHEERASAYPLCAGCFGVRGQLPEWPERSSVRLVGDELIQGDLAWLVKGRRGEVGFTRYSNEYNNFVLLLVSCQLQCCEINPLSMYTISYSFVVQWSSIIVL